MNGSRQFATMLSAAFFAAIAAATSAQEAKPRIDESFYAKSLHYTNRGIEFIYSKEQGGVERLTGVPF